MRSSKAKLAIIPCDVSDNTKKKLTNCASFHNVELLTLPCTGEFLAQKLGKRAKVTCAVITDESFVNIIEKIYSDIHTRFTEVQQ
jgi:ribosomal protein L30E